MEFLEQVTDRGKWDVIVAGGGVAGVAAAVSAAREGGRVLLVEKAMKLGGLATLGLINWFVPMCDGRGRQIIFGMAEEFLRMAIRYGYDTLPETIGEARYATRFSPELFALTLTELLVREGVTPCFDSVIARPVMRGAHAEGLLVENKSGREYYRADVIVDCTGDADVLYRAGVPTVARGNYHTYIAYAYQASDQSDISARLRWVNGGIASLYGDGHPQDLPLYSGTSADSVNEYLIRNQLELLEKLKGDDRRSRDLVTLPGMAQFRTTRRIDGDYVLQETDAYRHFPDSIACINDFDRRDYLYEIPMRCLVRTGFDNLLTAGRSAAGDGYAWDVLRVIPPAILTGQAAGLIAMQAIREKKPVFAVDVATLQAKMIQGGNLIHFEDSWVQKSVEKG